MKCFACGFDGLKENDIKCPHCEFPVIDKIGGGNSIDYEEKMKKMAREFLSKKLKGIEIGMAAYSYQMVDGSLQHVGTIDILILEQNFEYIPGKKIWYNKTKFARVDAGEPLILDTYIKRKDRKLRDKLKILAPATDEFWSVGIQLEPQLKFRFLVGDRKKFAKSEVISLLA